MQGRYIVHVQCMETVNWTAVLRDTIYHFYTTLKRKGRLTVYTCICMRRQCIVKHEVWIQYVQFVSVRIYQHLQWNKEQSFGGFRGKSPPGMLL